MAKQVNVRWVSEEEAAKAMQMNPLYFRRQVTAGPLQSEINYTRLHSRCIQYNMIDIEQYKMKRSTLQSA